MFLPWRQGRNKVPALLGRARNGRGEGEWGLMGVSLPRPEKNKRLQLAEYGLMFLELFFFYEFFTDCHKI